jgi:hypothetical protein
MLHGYVHHAIVYAPFRKHDLSFNTDSRYVTRQDVSADFALLAVFCLLELATWRDSNYRDITTRGVRGSVTRLVRTYLWYHKFTSNDVSQHPFAFGTDDKRLECPEGDSSLNEMASDRQAIDRPQSDPLEHHRPVHECRKKIS